MNCAELDLKSAPERVEHGTDCLNTGTYVPLAALERWGVPVPPWTCRAWRSRPPPTRTSSPLRQWVLTLPFELRARIAYDRELCGRITRLFADSVLGFYRRTMRDLHRVGKGQSGAITVVQRVSSDLRLNPHLHLLALDGVFVDTDDGQLAFHQLPALDNSDVADLLHTARVRILAFLERRGVIERGPDPRLADDGFAEREPELAALATAAVTGNPPAGPEHRQRPLPPLCLTSAPRAAHFFVYSNMSAGLPGPAAGA